MLAKPMDVLAQFPVRKSKKQKQAFRDAVQSYAESLGYSALTEQGSFGSRNVVIGVPAKAKYLVTAHYDTCARLPFPNLITPTNLWLFLGYQLFTVMVMLAFMAAGGVIAYLVTRDKSLTTLVTYIFLWLFLCLMMFGPANKHNANDNTSGVVTALEILRTLPENQKDKVCFVLFDLEEAGLLGSSAYRNKHKQETDKQVILNLDCVGDGDEILFFPSKKARKNTALMDSLRKCVGTVGRKQIAVVEKGFSVYPSDQGNFPLGVGIAAFNRSSWAGLYMGKIHTHKDTVLDETNVNVLRAALTSLISADTAE